MAQRIKGQEVELLLLQDSTIVANVMSIKSFEMEFMQDLLSEGYLGETTERKDSIFKGIQGKFELHVENQSILTVMIPAILAKSRRRTPGTRFNLKATLNFPNGNRPRVVIPDIEFGAIPTSFGSRNDYYTVTLNYAASDVQTLPG